MLSKPRSWEIKPSFHHAAASAQVNQASSSETFDATAHAAVQLAKTSDERCLVSVGVRSVDNARSFVNLSTSSIDNVVVRGAEHVTRNITSITENQVMKSRRQPEFDDFVRLIAKLVARRWQRLQVDKRIASNENLTTKNTTCTTTEFGSVASEHAQPTNHAHRTDLMDTK